MATRSAFDDADLIRRAAHWIVAMDAEERSGAHPMGASRPNDGGRKTRETLIERFGAAAYDEARRPRA